MCGSIGSASSRVAGVLGVVLLSGVLAGCGGDEAAGTEGGGAAPADTADGGASPAASTPAAEPQPVDPATAGSITGVVRHAGPAPEPARLTIAGETYCVQLAKEAGGYRNEALVVKDGKVQNVFVWITDDLEDEFVFDDPEGAVEIDQKGCIYEPRVVGVRTGQNFRFLNSDPILHNVHTKPTRNKERNLAMPQAGDVREMDFRKEEVMVEVACDVHAWMRGWIGVVDHPYFTVTGADGRFRLDGVPPGTYTVQAWHEELGTREVEVAVGEGEDVEVSDLSY